MEALSKLLVKAQDLHFIEGISLGSGNEHVGVTHLFFANDSLIFS